MAEFEQKKRVTKNDKKHKKSVYTSKHLRITEQLYEKRRDHEAIDRISRSKTDTGVLKGHSKNS
jgi:hypothetical protein